MMGLIFETVASGSSRNTARRHGQLAGAIAFVVVAGLLGGCASSGSGDGASNASAGGTVASVATVANLRRVGFLTDYDRLTTAPGGSGLLCWRDAGVSLKPFDKVLFERIQVYLKPDAPNPVDPTDLKMLTDYFHASLVKAIKPEAQIVDKPGPDVLLVRIALTDLVPTNQAASLAGTAVPYGFVAEIGAGEVSGRPAGSTPYLGQTGMEVQFRDGASGKILGECADRQIGLKYAADMNAGLAGAAETWANGYMSSFQQWSYAKAAFDKWSAAFARRYAELRKS